MSELNVSRLDERPLTLSGPSESVNVQGGSSKERVPPLSACDRIIVVPTKEDLLRFESGKTKPKRGDHGTFSRVPKADNFLSNQESRTEESKPNENDGLWNNPELHYNEELYLLLSRSDDPLWDFLHHRIIWLEEKGNNITVMEAGELQELRVMDDGLRWGKYLGGETPGSIFLRYEFYRNTLDIRIRHLISRSWIEDKEVQNQDPVLFYLIWRSKKQSRETLWLDRWEVDPRMTVHEASIDGVIRNLLPLEGDSNRYDKACDCCNKLLTLLRESGNVLYEPEIRYLEKLLGKVKPKSWWNLASPISLACVAASFFGSMTKLSPRSGGYYSSLVQGLLFTAASLITAAETSSILASRRRAEHWSQHVLLGVSVSAGLISCSLRMWDESDNYQPVVVVLDLLLGFVLGLYLMKPYTLVDPE
ncbi:hypothetical protein C7M61_003493 [Candidozyma pseudohaemuli]|uniref:Uncharacterized protein n=1 Tax=Candidozyma pseudohaemuli TaxID=418784 RepID=A0A2P7YM68_9ASCO|nr:hypothetical protein C7M61_003493 [[Candida] pseudohaemulonii]PSK37066.1 hypothetical protein C7M61_003493 [[Candida] pseudohaemulonii]